MTMIANLSEHKINSSARDISFHVAATSRKTLLREFHRRGRSENRLRDFSLFVVSQAYKHNYIATLQNFQSQILALFGECLADSTENTDFSNDYLKNQHNF